jgi:eukaryotic-like serine/threonine-protein kinase
MTAAPDGRWLAAGERDGLVTLWQLPGAADGRGAEISPAERAWQAHRGRAYALAFAPRQPRLAAGGHENYVAIWPLGVGRLVLKSGEAGQRTQAAHSLAFSPDARELMVAASDGVQSWDLALGQRLRVLSRHGQPRDHVALAGDARYLAAGQDAQRVVEVWQRASAR